MRIARLALAAMAGLSLLGGAAAAEDYPTQAITIVVPYSAGGTTDTVARIVADGLSQELGQPVIVENKPGTSGIIGAEYVARAKPDGYTLLMGTISTHATNASLFGELPYDPIKDFEPVALAAQSPNMLIVNPDVPAKTLEELVQLLKDNPGKYTYGSNGAGTSQHLTAESFKAATGTDILHVPYKGSGSMILDVIAGNIDMSFDNMPTALAQMKAGTVRGLAVTSAKPVPQAPDMPTIATVVPGFTSGSWQGLFAPAGIDEEKLKTLVDASEKVLAKPDVQEKLQGLGATAGDKAGAEFKEFVQSETNRWADVIAKAGIQKN
ncbi:tripartite tricarboxylate transporter substrate binding protein [Afifella sp. IM 167]|uniref:Bug family tripartite tricarboxylate transporter substrate binding protein n=1 Tax=Afifella sp. IM 167 TaxID=2033586 RepID=UPI001CC9E533|nr:tripartite tricarboxylate transporter substrate binding protein [Afifella sp. IM 167]MBZ8133322.1 LacI family transcriptional regulator [Afifella sp. IM 167]